MSTECKTQQLEFQGLGRREVVGKFDGGKISSDGGGLLLREVERRTKIIKRFGKCFWDHRDERLIEHSVEELVGQRVYGIALGYEDLNDHEELRRDPLMGVLVGKQDPEGRKRVRTQDRGCALAGKSTLNRLELTSEDAHRGDRYKKVVYDQQSIDNLLLDIFVESYESAPVQIVLDVDATDDPVHGGQEGRFFHGYYGLYCYLPLYIFCGEHLLCARLRSSNIDASKGIEQELERIVGELRGVWPCVKIVVRGDSDFSREALMKWCEDNGVDYVFGIAKNERLKRAIAGELEEARDMFESTGKAARVYKDFRYRTLESWSRQRRVVGKAEYLSKGANQRFVVTSVPGEGFDARALYEDLYCARGDMENRIKEQQLMLFADRTSTRTMRSNQLRLYFSSIAYCLMQALRRLGLVGTEMARAQCDTIRLKLLKIGAQVRVSVRKVWVSLSESYPYAQLFWRVYSQLRASPIAY